MCSEKHKEGDFLTFVATFWKQGCKGLHQPLHKQSNGGLNLGQYRKLIVVWVYSTTTMFT